jgi:cell division transport system ATP-binding protein
LNISCGKNAASDAFYQPIFVHHLNMSKVVISLKDAAIYQQDFLVLSNVQLEVKKNEFVYLIGKTGSGKSSILKTLYADLALRSGLGHVAGFDLNTIKPQEVPFLRRKLGIVFQDFQLLMDRNVYENLSFVLKATGQKETAEQKIKIDYALSQVGLKSKSHKMPHELSGGEQQRIVIARALINNPEIILADEPTGNLDPETSSDIIELMREIHSDTHTSFLIATHDYSLFEKAPGRIIKCRDGKLLEDSDPIQLR